MKLTRPLVAGRAGRLLTLPLLLLLATAAHELQPGRASAQEAAPAAVRPDASAQEASRRFNSDGSMQGVDLQHTRVFKTRALREPKSVYWQSGKLFVMGRGNVFLITGPFGNTVSGAGWWSSGHGFAAPVIAGDTIFFSLYISDGYLFALDRETGKDRWRIKAQGDALSSPAVAGGAVYFGTGSGTFIALDAATGRERWRLTRRGRGGHVAPPVVYDGVVYFSVTEVFGSASRRPEGKIYAFDARTGQDVWEFKARASMTSPAVADDTLYAGGDDGRLRALGAKTGREKWNFKTDKEADSPALMDGTVFFGDGEGRLYAVGGADGKLKWKSDEKFKTRTALALAHGAVYFGERKRGLRALDAATGQERWELKTEQPCSAPSVAETFVYSTCGDEFVYAVDARTGQEKWKFKQEKVDTTAPVIADGVMYLLRADGLMYALR